MRCFTANDKGGHCMTCKRAASVKMQCMGGGYPKTSMICSEAAIASMSGKEPLQTSMHGVWLMPSKEPLQTSMRGVWLMPSMVSKPMQKVIDATTVPHSKIRQRPCELMTASLCLARAIWFCVEGNKLSMWLMLSQNHNVFAVVEVVCSGGNGSRGA